MALELDAVAFTWTWLGFSPGAGLCSQTPVIDPFWLLYPYPGPLHSEPLALADPPPEPGLLPPPLTVVGFEVEPPHPMMTRTWSANANEQRKERKSRNIRYPRCEMRPVQLLLSQMDGNVWRTQIVHGLLILSGEPTTTRKECSLQRVPGRPLSEPLRLRVFSSGKNHFGRWPGTGRHQRWNRSRASRLRAAHTAACSGSRAGQPA